jgi:hypothetical protein
MHLAYPNIAAAKGYEIIAIVDRDKSKQGQEFSGTPIISPEKMQELDAKLEEYDCVITIRTEHVVNEVKEWLKCMKHAEVYEFEDFMRKKKISHNLYKVPFLQVHMVDHCNLNCVRCFHFSPLVKKDGKEFYLDPDVFEKDMIRIAELMEGDLAEIHLMGGEPLLHPELYKFPYIIKKHLPHTHIVIITNGLLLERMEEKFYQSCLDNNVQIWATRYPINFAYDSVVEKLREKGIDIVCTNSGNSEEESKRMGKVILHPEGGLDGERNFEECPDRCFTLRDGYLYVCTQGAFIDYFNQYFGTQVATGNGINIYEANSLKEITDFLSNKAPLCDYCNTLERADTIPWAVSDRKMREWTDVED